MQDNKNQDFLNNLQNVPKGPSIVISKERIAKIKENLKKYIKELEKNNSSSSL